MAQKVTVDLADKHIVVNPGVTSLDAEIDLYSDLKEDWVANANGEFAFEFPIRTIGGDPIGGGLEAGAFFFLRNDLGWRIQPQETDHELTILGNLYGEDVGLPLFDATEGPFTVMIRLQTSSLTQLAGEVLGANPIAELTGVPPPTPTPRQALAWLYTQTRNLVTGSRKSLKQKITDSQGTVIAEAPLSDDGVTFTRGKFVNP